MRGLLIFGAIILTIAGCIHEQEATNHGLPLVHASAPKHGFVCVPAITPHMGPVRTKEWT